MKVLIADDSPIIREILVGMLKKWGHEVVVCEDGTEAWGALQKDDAPKLAILDWEMPGLDGVSICRKLLKKNQSKETFVNLLTSREETSDLVEGLEAGADDYITKPFKQAELLARLNVGIRMLDMQSKLVGFERMKTLTLTAGAAAHEINQPLTVIIGNSDILLLKLDAENDVRHNVEHIREAGKRISEIVKKMGEIKLFVTKSYVGSTNIIDFDASAEAPQE